MSLIPGIRSAVRLAANQTFTSNATLATLTGFSMPVAAGAVVIWDFSCLVTLGATGGLRFQPTTPAGGSINGYVYLRDTVTPATITANITALNTAFTNALAVAGTHQLRSRGTFVNGVTAGTFALQVAQNTVDVLTATFLAGANCNYIQVN